MYADDLVIMSPSVAGLYKLIHICESFGLSHDVLFNNKKSTIMSFRAGNLKDAQLPLHTINGDVLCDSACVKYLGHFICSDLSDDTDILRQRRCLTIQGNILLRKFHMCSIGVRLALFRSFCSPMYTSQLWWNYKKCTMKRLLITYHNVFKMSISMSKYESTSVLCTVYNVLRCQAVIRNLVYRFMCRLQASNNSLVMSIQSSSLVYGQGSHKLYNSSLKLSKYEVHCRRLYDTNLSSTTYHLNISKTKRRWDNCTYMFRPLQYRYRVWKYDTSRL